MTDKPDYEPISKYDAEQDSAPFRYSMTQWANFGFMAGVCGVKPMFFGDLPSSVFYNSFLDQLPSVNLSSTEASLRITYGDQMQDRLFKIEKEAFEKRISQEQWGVAVRTVLVLLLMVVVVASIVADYQLLGIFLFLGAFGLGMVLPRIAGQRDKALTATAFMPDRIRMPWMVSSASTEAENR